MDPNDVVESTLRLQESLQTFIDHVGELTVEDDPSGDGFTREFRVIRDLGMKMRDDNTHPAEEGRQSYNVKKNRYKDILPFDETRVALDEIPGEDGSDYINANFIQDQYGSNCYIASQGPLPHTVYDFWRMIMQYRVKVVAMACKMVEMGKNKCQQYWPDEVDGTVEFRDISVTLVLQEELGNHSTKRTLRASKPGCDSLTVTQFHYTGWPDHDIPNDFDVILEMMAGMREIKASDAEKSPMVVHCSAGCGRTGTICAIDYSWDLLKSGNMDKSFSLYDIVISMREQRQSMIQTPDQYMMAHVTVQSLFEKHLDLMEDHTYGNVDFGNGNDGNADDGSVSDTSEASDRFTISNRKSSIMAQDIANTIKKITHAETVDEILTPTNTPASFPLLLPEPLKPTPAVYVASPEPITTSPKVMDISDKFKDDSKAYRVEKIENIPRTNKVEMRYLGRPTNASIVENSEKKLSFISTESRKKELEDRKAMFEKLNYATQSSLEAKKSEPENQKAMFQKSNITTKPSLEAKKSEPGNRKSLFGKSDITTKPSLEAKKSEPENRKSMFEKPDITTKPSLVAKKSEPENRKSMFGKPDITAKSSLEAKKSDEQNVITKTELNNNLSEKGQPIQKRDSQVQKSQLMDNKKFVTVLSVGGSSGARPLNKSISAPGQPFSTAQYSIPRSKTIPGVKVNPFQDTPQSSMPPAALPSQQGVIYTSAGNSSFYSSLTNYSSVPMATHVTGPNTDNSGTKSGAVGASATATGNSYSELTNYTGNAYSDLTNYGTGVESVVPASRSFDHYSSVDEITGGVTLAMPQREVTPTNQQAGQVYSFAENERLYSAVSKPMASTKDWNGTTGDAVYESVAVGDAGDKAPPPIPDRGYADDEHDNQINDKAGTGDINTLGKRTQLTSAIKSLFSGKTGVAPSTSDHIVPSDIPGFKARIGRAPRGQQAQPAGWKKN